MYTNFIKSIILIAMMVISSTMFGQEYGSNVGGSTTPLVQLNINVNVPSGTLSGLTIKASVKWYNNEGVIDWGGTIQEKEAIYTGGIVYLPTFGIPYFFYPTRAEYCIRIVTANGTRTGGSFPITSGVNTLTITSWNGMCLDSVGPGDDTE